MRKLQSDRVLLITVLALLVFGLEGLGPLRRFDPKAGALVLTDAGDETEAHVIGANFRKLSQGESQLPR